MTRPPRPLLSLMGRSSVDAPSPSMKRVRSRSAGVASVPAEAGSAANSEVAVTAAIGDRGLANHAGKRTVVHFKGAFRAGPFHRAAMSRTTALWIRALILDSCSFSARTIALCGPEAFEAQSAFLSLQFFLRCLHQRRFPHSLN